MKSQINKYTCSLALFLMFVFAVNCIDISKSVQNSSSKTTSSTPSAQNKDSTSTKEEKNSKIEREGSLIDSKVDDKKISSEPEKVIETKTITANDSGFKTRQAFRTNKTDKPKNNKKGKGFYKDYKKKYEMRVNSAAKIEPIQANEKYVYSEVIHTPEIISTNGKNASIELLKVKLPKSKAILINMRIPEIEAYKAQCVVSVRMDNIAVSKYNYYTNPRPFSKTTNVSSVIRDIANKTYTFRLEIENKADTCTYKGGDVRIDIEAFYCDK